jgi:hypothetical protein
MKREYLLVLTLAAVVSAMLLLHTVTSAAEPTVNQELSYASLPKKALLAVIEKTLSENELVRDDLMRRGLFVLPRAGDEGVMSPDEIRKELDKRGSQDVPVPPRKICMIPGEIKVGEIGRLVQTGVYHVTSSNKLISVPRMYPP